MPTSTDLNTPILEGGLQRIPFFNGRVLTAEDLNTEQDANAQERRRLGRVHGPGVLEGLFVRSTDDSTTVRVEPGLALAPSGQTVALPQRTKVSVVSEIDRNKTGGTEGQFANCSTQHAIATSGTGAYLLVLEPASGTQGRVPRTSFRGDGVAGECGAQYRVEGARLRLVCLDTTADALVPPPIQTEVQEEEATLKEALQDGDDPAPAILSRLRNLLAHACLRTPQVPREAADLYTTLRDAAQGKAGPNSGGPAGPTDVQAYSDVGPDAVPIGLLYWAQDRILFVDSWSVRRRVHRSDPQRPTPATDRRRAETEAAIYQFQDHVADLVQTLGFRERVELGANDLFPFLPPLGTIPNEQGDRDGFDIYEFFDGLSTRDYLHIEGATLRDLMSEATRVDPFRTDTEQLVWRYRVREDMQSSRGEDPSSFVVFTSGFVPHAAEPQYNLSRFGYANYGPGVAVR